MLDFLAGADARHRALSAAGTRRIAPRHGRRRGLGRPARRPAARRRCAALARRCSAPASAARSMADAGLRGLVAARQAGGARLRRGAAPLPRDLRASATRSPSACCAERPRAVHRRRRAGLQPRPGGAAARRARHARPCTSSARRSGPGAASRVEKMAAQLSTTCCACSRSSPTLLHAARRRGHLRRPSAGRRDPARAAARRGARRAGPGATTTRWWRCCRAAGAPRSQHIAPAVPAGRGAAARASGPALRFVLPVAPGLRALLEPLLARARRTACRSQLLDGRSHDGAGRLRRDARSPAARPRSRPRCSSGRWSSPTACTR
ncbi:MAG: hypothetical protein MZW92_54740 [Comamonadaceae bacterium]|nr:hypothetical protein [Comamonadaceae bacterium]